MFCFAEVKPEMVIGGERPIGGSSGLRLKLSSLMFSAIWAKALKKAEAAAKKEAERAAAGGKARPKARRGEGRRTV